MAAMEVLSNADYVVLRQNQYSLWCSRGSGGHHSEPPFKPIIVSDNASYESFVCHGLVYGLIGVFQADKLVLIKESQSIGDLPHNHNVFKIRKIAIINLSAAEPIAADIALDPCSSHNCTKPVSDPLTTEGQTTPAATELAAQSQTQPTAAAVAPHQPSSGVQKTWNQIKWTASHVKPRVVARINPNNQNESKDKTEKRLIDELYKMFTETESFYYSLSGDLTNSQQRQQKLSDDETANGRPLWRRVDDRFFWNKAMLRPIIECEASGAVVDPWILPLIQGYVKIETCFLDLNDTANITTDCKSLEDVRVPVDTNAQCHQELYTMTLISRRSRFRAGTRYKRRGVDEKGKCANYVETEQIFKFGSHVVSFVAVRGSVPIYWSQIGHKYRPPPRIDRNEEETQLAFNKHFNDEFDLYGNQVIVSLVEKSGREKIIADAYLNHVLHFDSPDISYVSFDFHDYCRGMRFENVSVLIDSVREIIKDMRYCWTDSEGLICEQRGVFRINCIDCLDRTNIVMTAIARTVMDTQFVRLGLLPPEGQLSANCRRIFQMMWANNGDIISRQYAGTVALKGDFTRTGERRFTGVVRDGYHSANRYYLNRFKDAYRQAVIDLMQGLTVSDDLNSPDGNDNAVDGSVLSSFSEQEHHERVKMVIDDCKKILIPEYEVILGGWPLVDADPVTGSSSVTDTDMDTVLVLTKDCYYVAEYDDQTDRIIKYQKVLLEDLEKIELGSEPNQIFSMKSSQSCCIRFHYTIDGQSGYFHMFRSTNTRFFNNMAIAIRNVEEAVESLKAICESFKVALSVKELNVPFYEGKLDRRKSKLIHANRGLAHNSNLLKVNQIPRNISDGQLLTLKSVGSRAITGLSSQFSRLKGKWTANEKPQTIRELPSATAKPGATSVAFNVESSGEEDSEEEDSLRTLQKQRILKQSLPLSVHSSERTFSSDYSECSDIDDQELCGDASIESADIQSNRGVDSDRVLESCGILATSPHLTDITLPTDSEGMVIKASNKSVFAEVDDFVLDAMKRASLKHLHRKASQSSTSLSSAADMRAYPSTPLIHIDDTVSCSELLVSSVSVASSGGESFATKNKKSLSKSSEVLMETNRATKSVANEPVFRAAESYASLNNRNDLSALSISSKDSSVTSDSLNVYNKMKTSHSETAIQDFSSGLSLNLPNPPLNVKKDLVLSPLSRIAKGVQHLSSNLRTGLIAGAADHAMSPIDTEAHQLLHKRKTLSKSRIIEL
ncbi:unnamed protein product [Medioppia subpectinata]|uniref:Phosphatidylinositide phosphatase SAC2 n=1 Tax=Medioppia subpectinata TaxID=1979941 RepID=A0A7R9PZD9_9ACAR|nr:unnamed protein product [Medioppia subpectinata]CAG2106379.1 unnamed protein product [Medioppia subpectinata]